MRIFSEVWRDWFISQSRFLHCGSVWPHEATIVSGQLHKRALKPNNMLGIHFADWGILTLYFVVIVGVGIWSAAKINNVTDFFMGGRRFGKAFMMFFAFGSGTSSDQAITVVAGTWRAGLAGIWWQFLWLPVTPFYWLIAPMLRRLRALTTADIFGNRFSPSVAVLYSIYGIIISIVLIAGGLYGSGKMINALTGNALDDIAARQNIQVPSISLKWVKIEDAAVPINELKPKLTVSVSYRRLQGYEFAILAMTILFVGYGMAGGLGAAIVTDFIQGILTIAFSIMLLPFVYSKIGGFGALQDAADLKPRMFDFMASPQVASLLGQEPITLFYIGMLSITALTGIIVQPHIVGVCGAGKTEYEGRYGFTVGNFLKRLCTVAWTFTGMACIAWYLSAAGPLATSADPTDQALYQDLQARVSSDYENLPAAEAAAIDSTDRAFADELFGRAAYDILPAICPGLIGLLMASLLAAVMSTSDAQMVMSSGLFTESLYKRYVAPFRKEMHYVWVGRLAGLMIVAAALLLQAFFTDVVHAMKVIIKTPAIIGVSLWFGLFWKRWNPTSVWVSTIVGATVWFYASYFGPELYNGILPVDSMFRFVDGVPQLGDSWQMVFVLLATVCSGILTSLLTEQQSPEQLDRFFQLLRTPVELDEKVIIPCRVPENSVRRDPVIEVGEWQFPKPTKLGMVGFGSAWLAVFVIIGFTWLLSRVI